MFNIGFGELAIICIVLIIAVGPERLPSMMKTVGKTMRTLRQASRDLRASTGIDELLREDFDYHPPPPRPRPPEEPAPVSRDEPVAAAALPSDEPVTTTPPEITPPVPPVPHASVEGTLPSDAPVAAPEPSAAVATPEPKKSAES
ncbi:MAG TPA: twin-arginine translocase TatA/TatE family subunit [Polyangiales bacterium]|nr:twin-arginine translocase TatA/TatE family subunit [Polyangiales bacterium]